MTLRHLCAAACGLAGTAVSALAGGVERNVPSTAILFETGSYVELSYAAVFPETSGTQQFDTPPIGSAGADSGNVSPDYSYLTFAFHQDVSDRLSFALIVDEPVGAHVDYAPGSDYAYNTTLLGAGGSQAEINSHQVTVALRYEVTPRVSVYGGLRAVDVDGEVSLFNGYSMQAETGAELGYMVGAAYEIPDIALRVALTYYSATEHEFQADEELAGLSFDTDFDLTVPQSVSLEAQTGVAENTLVFGSIRWVDWSEFAIVPEVYTAQVAPGEALVSYDEDVWTYSLGVARRLNETWAVSGTLGYEAQQGGFASNLGPTDGRTSVGVAAIYTHGPLRVTGGIQHIWIGSAETEAPESLTGGIPGVTLGEFEDNTAIAAGLRIGYQF